MITLVTSFWETLKRIISTSFQLVCMAIFFPRNRKSGVENTSSNFSVGSYLEEIEKVHLSILEEQENREPYIITLWWGLDGVRLNDAGEVEWISRRDKPKVNSNSSVFGNTIYFHSPYLTYPTVQWNGMTQSIDAGIQNMTNGINSNLQSKIEDIQRLQFQAAQMEQNARIHNIRVGRDMSGRIIRR